MGECDISETGITDAAVLARSIVEPPVFGELFERHFDAVHRYLARRVGSEHADDLASQTFVVAFERRESFDPDAGEVRGWLLGIATHLLWNDRRAEARLLRLVVQMQSEPALTPPCRNGGGTVRDVPGGGVIVGQRGS